ncbi:MAG: 16S rRNA (uracil(1498)-N(3))-methyltransferase [Synechococcus sp.]
MAELRRLLMAPDRLRSGVPVLGLEADERHYLRRVLRLRPGDHLAVVDGQGHRWTAQLGEGGEQLDLQQPLEQPMETMAAPCPRLGLAVVGVRRGMDEVMRMACELGVDCIQPLRSQWRTSQAEDRPERWQTILKEAVEQCERLWMPELCSTLEAKDWWEKPGDGAFKALATTRQQTLMGFDAFLEDAAAASVSRQRVPDPVWIAIGPEAGWTPIEQRDAERLGWTPVQLGGTILRTSTAAVAAATMLRSWRDRVQRSDPSTPSTHGV